MLTLSLFISTLNANQTKKEIQKELERSVITMKKHLPNKINKYLEASHNEVEGMTYITHYYTYLTKDKNLEKAKKEINKFQNKIIVGTCSDEYRRNLMDKYDVSFKFDFMDEFGKLSGFELNEKQCQEFGITVKK